jgi:endonuclease YncB( thermonuclease family)
MPPTTRSASKTSATTEEILHATKLSHDFSFAGYEGLAKVVEEYDGDTVRIAFIPHGAAAPIQYKVRMAGYDSPELHPRMTVPNRAQEMKAASDARDALRGKIGEDGLVSIKCGAFDKYGRILVTMFARDGTNINEWMLANGYGVAYGGGHKDAYAG